MRKKEMSGDRYSLFLDIYPPAPHPKTGKPIRKHYLKLFLYKRPADYLQRRHNTRTMELATTICANRQLDVQEKRFSFISDSERDGNFITFFEQLRDKRRRLNISDRGRRAMEQRGRNIETAQEAISSNWHTWNRSIDYLKAFAGSHLSFREIDEYFCEEYADFLLSAPAIGERSRSISHNTASTYFGRFRLAMKYAFKAKLLTQNLHDLVEPIAPNETSREFLFQEELQLLANTPCKHPILKAAALLSAVTGLRFSDIEVLSWLEIRGVSGHYFIQFRQEKTRSVEVLPISDIAVNLLGVKPANLDCLVFPGLTYSLVDNHLQEWVEAAGLSKKITFHCFRHTFATLQLAAGTDILVVSKMLGHRRLETTLIYVKIVNRLKNEAANRISIDISSLKVLGEYHAEIKEILSST